MDKTPRHIAFIMDGNRRFAKEHGQPSFEGHRAGYAKLKEVGDWCLEAGVEFVTVYAFSTENWKRSGEEVDFLMQLFYRAVTEELQEFHAKGIRLRILGRKEGLSPKLIEAFKDAEAFTAQNKKATLSLAINYGGRAELVDAFQEIVNAHEAITEETIAKHLTTKDLPDPDLVVRTSGEQRLSGFLTWQSVYAELMFVEKHWPALTKQDFQTMLSDFADRERRYGK